MNLSIILHEEPPPYFYSLSFRIVFGANPGMRILVVVVLVLTLTAIMTLDGMVRHIILKRYTANFTHYVFICKYPEMLCKVIMVVHVRFTKWNFITDCKFFHTMKMPKHDIPWEPLCEQGICTRKGYWLGSFSVYFLL